MVITVQNSSDDKDKSKPINPFNNLLDLMLQTSYDRGRSFFSLYKASRETLATLTTLNRTPGISPTA